MSATPAAPCLLHALNLVKTHPGAEKPAVDHLNMHLEQGEFLSILGRSGSGKSTLLHILSSLILPDAGKVLFQGRDICAAPDNERNHLRRRDFAVVFQQHHLLPYLSALENVLLPFLRGLSPITAQEQDNARRMLEKVGLSGKENSLPGRLSGGEQQRVAIARALARGARILFADEPTGSLDSVTGTSIIQLLRDLNREGLSIIMVTHNPEFASWTSRSITMGDGRTLQG
ncbi:MAG: ABC transporter ATP-binding protein [Deltaproteobacteria bacterium]|jgi:putative ABC transport system ATP-binding protein|nr:ABC transporter ATP-binding protein [Deltaproteobacteria bacterium]